MSNPINELKLYFGDDYEINQYITVHNPTVGDVIEMGETEYFTALHTLIAIPSDMKSILWDMGICWMDISDYDLFIMIAPTLTLEQSRIFFGDLDFTKFIPVTNQENNEPVLLQFAPDHLPIVIDNGIYLRIVKILRTIHNITPKVEYAMNKTTRNILIELDRQERLKRQNMDEISTLQPLISAMVNSEGFKYDLQGLRKMPYYAFLDSIQRISLIKNASALLQGCYGGWVDGSKIDKENLNWMKQFKIENNNIQQTKQGTK